MADRITLASASPRRLDLLRLAGFDPDVSPADIDETPHPQEAPETYAARVAGEKAAVVSARAPGVVVAADTIVVLDAHLLGKPADAPSAAAMLGRLQGRTHQVSTAVAVHAGGVLSGSIVVTTKVAMTELDDETIARYVAGGEPLDKAGGYGIQGGAAAFVRAIEGSYTNVVGLPLVETLELLRNAGIRHP